MKKVIVIVSFLLCVLSIINAQSTYFYQNIELPASVLPILNLL